ncbi:sensor histidine kinase [Ornithinimicrobium pratense]|uniref:histidine kinase n=1 Tax=Ornithinimicrobium pratense TaxID=2593973 RepID=A0A5J6V1K0_9MICO|nr:ATP-binding protein [Ornithinimicrobium pratense]QFG67457.1 cyclic nucleotide-binding domain-containing protein [Ornithinimicrobium pratense]
MTVATGRSSGPPEQGDALPCAVVVGAGELAAGAAQELAGVCGCVRRTESVAQLESWEPEAGRWVALVLLVDDHDLPALDHVVHALVGRPAFTQARLLVVTARSSLTDISGSVDSGRIDGVVAAPWTPGNLARYAQAQIARATVLAGRSELGDGPTPALLRHFSSGAEDAAAELLQLLESVLGPRPRVHLREGVRITVPEGWLNQIFLVVRGRVALTVTSDAGEVVLHHASTGPLVGLLALTEMTQSTVTARTTTECEMVSLTLDQLDYALAREPRIGATLTALAMRALATRLRSSERLHVKNAALTAELRATVAELRATRAELVDQARLATLGELAAGIAHELNNPAATVTRGVEHLSTDLRRLLAPEPSSARRGRGAMRRLRGGRRRSGAPGAGASAVLDALVAAEDRDHVPARDERALRRSLSGTVSDPTLVRRLVAAGVTDPGRARALLEGPPELLARVEDAAGIGAALRAVRVAGHHIATLVSTLHTHARPQSPEQDLMEPTDVGATVQDALLLLDHRLRQVPVEVEVEADEGLPPVLSGPGLLTQVWTNLVTNAADALAREGEGRITVRVTGCRPADPAGPHVAPAAILVEVEDDGPGVPEGLREQIFTSRFTTRRGVVRSGLGLGLSIVRSIVARHGGRVTLTSQPGRTVFSVVLPAAGSPPLTPEEER